MGMAGYPGVPGRPDLGGDAVTIRTWFWIGNTVATLAIAFEIWALAFSGAVIAVWTICEHAAWIISIGVRQSVKVDIVPHPGAKAGFSDDEMAPPRMGGDER
jgi:hypothetical protein